MGQIVVVLIIIIVLDFRGIVISRTVSLTLHIIFYEIYNIVCKHINTYVCQFH